MSKPPDDEYSSEEAKARMAMALRGARIAGHKPMESLKRKKPKPKKTILGKIETKAAKAKKSKKKSDG